MSNYDNTNRGAIWKNERKTTDTHPDFTGEIDIEGVAYFLDAWRRAPDANPKAPSLKFKAKRKDVQPSDSQRSQDAQAPPGGGGGAPDDFSDDVPFVKAMSTEPRP